MEAKYFYRIVTGLALNLLIVGAGFAQEICDNAIDDDGNGLIDLNDPACNCDAIGGINNAPSLIPNPSFEEYTCLPQTFSQLSCAKDWVQATTPTSDYHHQQGAVNHLLPKPFPEGEGAVGCIVRGGWQEYVGTCLSGPLKAGEEQVFRISLVGVTLLPGDAGWTENTYGPLDLAVFGSSNCNALPVNTTGCPVGEDDWHTLHTFSYTPNSTWTEVEIRFTPSVDISTIILGSACNIPTNYDNPLAGHPYFGFDNLIINSAGILDTKVHDIREFGSNCRMDQQAIISVSDIDGLIQWYLNGIALVGETDTILNISDGGYGISGAGQYDVMYTANGVCKIVNIIIEPPVYPVASVQDTMACPGDTIVINSTSSLGQGQISRIEWDINSDGQIDLSGGFASVPVLEDTSVTTTLVVTSDEGCSDSTVFFVPILNPPVVDFAYTLACQGDTIVFSDSSESQNGAITEWEWDFKADDTLDGTASTALTKFDLYGTVQVQLAVKDDRGCVNSTTKEITVHPSPKPDFTLEGVCQNIASVFTGFSGTPGGQVVAWKWGLDSSFVSEEQNVSYTFSTSGIFPVNLEVTSEKGCKANVEKQIEIFPSPEIWTNSFESGCGDVCVPLSAQAMTLVDVVKWTWKFEDGTTIDSLNTEYCFSNTTQESKDFSAELFAESDQGCISHDTVGPIATVWPNPIADFMYSPDPIMTIDTRIEFDNLSSSDLENYKWDLAGFGTSYDVNPTVQLPNDSAGFYPVTLVVTNSFGCADTMVKELEVEPTMFCYVPNGFTPNDDGLNDIFKPIIRGAKEEGYRFAIFNRWGHLVFEATRMDQGWNGRDQFFYSDLSNTAYVWTIDLIAAKTGIRQRYTGKVNIVL